MLWGGVVTSCSNGSEDIEPVPPTKDEDVQEGWTAIAVGDIEKYNGNDGTASYTVTKNTNGSITISHEADMALYASCSFKTNFGDNNTLYTKITNNSDVAATVQVQVNKAGTEENDWQPTPTVTAVYVDGKKQSGDDVKYSVKVSIPAKGSIVIANKFDLSKNPDTVAISLNSQEEIAGTVAKGDITVSGISMKNVTDESGLETAENGAGQGTGTGTGTDTGNIGTGSTGTGTGNTGTGSTGTGTGNTGTGSTGTGTGNTGTGNTGTGNTGTDTGNTGTGTGEQLPAKMITFSVIEDSTNAEKTTLLFKYDRSAAGAKELVAIEKCGIIVKLNDTKVTKIDKLEFALDEYGSSFDDKDKNPIKDEKNMKEYKAKVSIAKQVKKGDKVVVYYNEGVGTITGEGKEAEAVNSLVVSLVDTDEKVDYYKELVENKNEYQPLFSKPDEPPAPPADPKPETPSAPGEKAEITFAAFDGWGKYDIAEGKGETVTMSHSKKVEKYGCCGMDIKFGKNNTVEFKVKNNGSETAYVKISVKNEAWSNENDSKSGILTATVNGNQLDYAGHGALAEIKPGETASFVLTLDTTLPEADKFVVSLNSEATEDGEAEMPSTGNITISDASMYTK